VEYLLDNYGQDKMLNLLTLLKQGNSYDEALTQVYEFDIDGLDSYWRRTLTNSNVITVSQSIEHGKMAEWQSHPALAAVLSALATALVL
jgi:hypothetical protein